MRRLMLVTAGTVAIFLVLAQAATKDREWKTGKVLDSATSKSILTTGAVTSGQAIGTATSTTSLQQVTIRDTELMIVGDQYLYIIEDYHRKGGPILVNALANRHHGCRFVVGEDIKYSQEKGDLHVLDADGKECKLPILRQERRDFVPPKR
jgi:hypothetical protein